MKRLIILLLAAAAVCSCASSNVPREQRQMKKQMKAEEYCQMMDSLIRTHVYSFRPQTMQVQPAGKRQQLTNINFRMDVRENYIQIFLPYIYGGVPPYRRGTMSYSLPYVPEYTAEQSPDGNTWTITFSSNLYGSQTYNFTMKVVPCTGNAELTITSGNNRTISYTGYVTKFY